MRDNSLKDFILDQLNELPEVVAVRMFNSWGLYSDTIFFGIINDGHLYFKTNEKTSLKYKELGMRPFQPSPKQKLKNYYEVPMDIIDNADELCKWATESVMLLRRLSPRESEG